MARRGMAGLGMAWHGTAWAFLSKETWHEYDDSKNQNDWRYEQ
jgi:hypothetical protein